MDVLAVNPNKELTEWSDLTTWLECFSSPLDFLCVSEDEYIGTIFYLGLL